MEAGGLLTREVIQVLNDLNPWWVDPGGVRPEPPVYRRRLVVDLRRRLEGPGRLIQVVRGPRQVGKTTGIQQIVQDLLEGGTPPGDILFVRFDLQILREATAPLRTILRWYTENVRRRPLEKGPPTLLFLDEVHKLPRWDQDVKHLGDTYPLKMLLTGSSSVLVARGGRESLAGRVFTTELPPFHFREVLECWKPEATEALPEAITFEDVFSGGLRSSAEALARLRPQQKLSLRRHLERYYVRGGYPRLHSGEVGDDIWAQYLVETVFENVLGADIPDLFPVENPGLLRHIYLSLARQTGREIAQTKLAQDAAAAGYPTNQPTIGRYVRYLVDALLVREFRRYPLARKASARVPSKITLTDLGVRNAVFRGAPSLWESDPRELGPLVETLVQGCVRGPGLQVHFFRDFENPKDRRTPVHEVDFVAERVDGSVIPLEVKFRKNIREEDLKGLTCFLSRLRAPLAVVVTRDFSHWDQERKILFVPLPDFLLAF